ncbi:MAG: formimidoylglutamase [Candidatus Kapaibacterium sp.]|jgi:formimidoylglutamase
MTSTHTNSNAMNSNPLRELCTPATIAPPPRAEAADRRFADHIRCAHSYSLDHSVEQKPALAILGVPQHMGVERNGGRAGAALAPSAIREQLSRLTLSNGGQEMPQRAVIVDAGNIVCEGLSLEQIHARQFEVVSYLLSVADAVVVLGGGHDTAYPNGRALASQHGSIGVVNIDAHLDVRPLLERGDAILAHSGSPFRLLLEDDDVHIPAGHFTEFGIQPFVAAAHHIQYVRDAGHHVHMLGDIQKIGPAAAFEQTLNAMPDAQALYCSFDLDAIASAFAPGVSAPATDGFTAGEALHFMRIAGGHSRCRLVDIVEGNPLFDADSRTMRLAAQMIAHFVWQKVMAL